MTWNYRIVHTKVMAPLASQGTQQVEYWGLYEVYYNDQGEPYTRTEALATFGSDADSMEVTTALANALSDAVNRPILEDDDIREENAPDYKATP